MATNPPSHGCMICGGKLEWRDVTRPRLPGEPVRFGPTDWELVPHKHTDEEREAWAERLFKEPQA